MIVDSHAHLLPRRLAGAVRAFFEAHIGDELAYPADPHVVLESHEAAGIEMVWNLPYAHRPGIAERLNADTAELSASLSTATLSVVPGCTVHPADEEPESIVERAIEGHGARVLKVHCSVGEHCPDDPRLERTWAVASDRGVPAVVHAGHATDGTTAADELAPLSAVLERHPDLRIVLAHLGAPATRTALDMMRRHPNLHADLTPVVSRFVHVAPDQVASLSHRLLFGTDAPNTGFTAAEAIERISAIFPDEDHRSEVLGGTARRLLSR